MIFMGLDGEGTSVFPGSMCHLKSFLLKTFTPHFLHWLPIGPYTMYPEPIIIYPNCPNPIFWVYRLLAPTPFFEGETLVQFLRLAKV